MNKYALHVAGGALLATTALASGTVYAATIRYTQAAGGIAGAVAAAGSPTAAITTPTGLATNIVGGATGSSVSIGPGTIVIDSSSIYTATQTVVQLSVVGAEFDTTSAVVAELWNNESATSLSLTSATAIGTSVFTTSDKITLNNVTALTWGALVLSNIKFRNAQGLATVGSVISLSGSILNSAGVLVLENITSANVVGARLGSAIEVATGTTIGANSNVTTGPQFSSITQGGVVSNSAVLSTVKFTDTVGVGANLSTTQSANTLVSNYEVRLTHAVLSDTPPLSTSSAIQYNSGGANVARTAGQFPAGVVTFTIGAPTAGVVTTTLSVNFSGTQPIAAAAAGTTVVTATGTAANLAGYAAVTGTAAAISRSGMNATLNFVQPSTISFGSFIRVTNVGSSAAAVTMAVRNSATGAVLGTYTSAPVASGGTIQVSAATLEAGSVPSIVPSTGVPYDVSITGSVSGFVQHIGFNSANGAASDLSSLRAGGSYNP